MFVFDGDFRETACDRSRILTSTPGANAYVDQRDVPKNKIEIIEPKMSADGARLCLNRNFSAFQRVVRIDTSVSVYAIMTSRGNCGRLLAPKITTTGRTERAQIWEHGCVVESVFVNRVLHRSSRIEGSLCDFLRNRILIRPNESCQESVPSITRNERPQEYQEIRHWRIRNFLLPPLK